jgi:hypothetical protein
LEDTHLHDWEDRVWGSLHLLLHCHHRKSLRKDQHTTDPSVFERPKPELRDGVQQ